MRIGRLPEFEKRYSSFSLNFESNFGGSASNSIRLKSVIDLLKSKARRALTAGDPITIAIASMGRLEASKASSGVVEPAVARTVGVRPSKTPALPKFACVYWVVAASTQLNILTQY